VFNSKSKDPKAAFNADTLADEIQNVVAQARGGLSRDESLKDTRPGCCRTFVVATLPRGAGGAIRMRTYNTLTAAAFRGRIWEAARATSAAPTFFSPIKIDDTFYGDGGTGYNNPTNEAIAEAHSIWPNRPIGCVVSIGTGLEEALQLDDDSQKIPSFVALVLRKTSPRLAFAASVADYCVRCLTSCENVHQQVIERADKDLLNGDYYFRLNVPQGMSAIGLDEWNKVEDIIALTISYMQRPERVKPKLNIAKLLRRPKLASISGW